MTKRAPQCDPEVLELGIPVLGICYGLQWITHKLGGEVEPAERREYGPMKFDVSENCDLFSGATKRTAHLEQPRRSCAQAARWLSRHRKNKQRNFCGGRFRNAESSRCNFILKLATQSTAQTFCAISCSKSATRSRIGAVLHSLPKTWTRFGVAWETIARSARSAAEWIPPSRRYWWAAPLAIDSQMFL